MMKEEKVCTGCGAVCDESQLTEFVDEFIKRLVMKTCTFCRKVKCMI